MLNFEKLVADVGGWLTKDEGIFLYEAAKKVPKDGIIIEIGSWKGRSTICLAKGSQDGNRTDIYAIDPHDAGDSLEIVKLYGKAVDTYQDFLANIRGAGVEDRVRAIKDTSHNFARKFNKPVDLLFIDGAHDYQSVKNDFNLWFPKLRNGGLILFHDCWHTAVHPFTMKVLIKEKVARPILIDTLTVIEKEERVNCLERFQNLVFIVYRLLVGWIGVIKQTYLGGTVLR